MSLLPYVIDLIFAHPIFVSILGLCLVVQAALRVMDYMAGVSLGGDLEAGTSERFTVVSARSTARGRSFYKKHSAHLSDAELLEDFERYAKFKARRGFGKKGRRKRW